MNDKDLLKVIAEKDAEIDRLRKEIDLLKESVAVWEREYDELEEQAATWREESGN